MGVLRTVVAEGGVTADNAPVHGRQARSAGSPVEIVGAHAVVTDRTARAGYTPSENIDTKQALLSSP